MLLGEKKYLKKTITFFAEMKFRPIFALPKRYNASNCRVLNRVRFFLSSVG